MDTCQLNVAVVVCRDNRLLGGGSELMMAVCVGVVGIVRGEFAGNVLNAELLGWLVVK